MHGPTAAGAMTRAMRAADPRPNLRRCLRLGVVRDGRIEQDEIVPHGRPATYGGTEKSTIVVLDEPRARVLFEPGDGRYVLLLRPGMRGRVSDGGVTRTVESLLAEGCTRVPISDAARGRVEVGGTAILFQLIPEPPARFRPQLPLAVRSGFLDGVDWVFTSMVAVSFVAYLCGIVVLESADYPIDESIASVPPEFISTVMPEMEPPPPDPEEEPKLTDTEPTDEATTESSTARNDRHLPDTPDRARPSRPDAPPTLVDRDQIRTAALDVLSTLGESRPGSAMNQLLEAAPTSDAADLLAMVDGAAPVADNGPEMRPDRGPVTSDEGRGIGFLDRGRHGTGPRDEGPAITETELPPYSVGLEPPVDVGGSGYFDSAMVVAQVRRRLGAVRRCYEHQLRTNPTMSGKVTMGFTIVEAGSVSGMRAVQNTTGSPALSACIGRSLSTMRFNPGPDGGSVSFSYPFVFAPQQ